MSGLSVSSSDECSRCDLKVKNGISTSVVDLKLDGPRLVITPSIPFEFTFNDKTVSVSFCHLMTPCPIRVENVQYDAVLMLIGDNGKFVLMIPIQATTTPDQASDAFLTRVVSHIPNLVQKPTESTSVPTGSDWSLTSVLPLTGDAKGELTMQNPFFYFGVPYPGMDDVIQQIDNQNMYRRLTGQTPLPYPYTADPRMKVIMMAKPATAGAFVMSCIHLLPTTPVATDTVPSKGVLYKPFICGEKKEEKKEKFTNKECNPFSVPPTPPPISSDMLITIILSVLGAIAGFIGVYFAVKYAAGPTGDIMKRIGEGLGKGLVAIKKSIPAAKIAVPAPASAPAPAPEAKKETPTLTPVQEKTAVKAEPEIEAAEKRLSSSLTQKNPFFQDKKAPPVEAVKKNDKTVKNLDAYRSSNVARTRRNLPPPVKRATAEELDKIVGINEDAVKLSDAQIKEAEAVQKAKEAEAAKAILKEKEAEAAKAILKEKEAEPKYRKLTSRPSKVMGQSPSKTRRAPLKPFQRKTATTTDRADNVGAAAATELKTRKDESVMEAQREANARKLENYKSNPLRNITPKNVPPAPKQETTAVKEPELTPAMVAQAEKAEPEYAQLKIGGPLPDGENRTLGNKKYTPVPDKELAERREARNKAIKELTNSAKRATTAKRVPQ